MNIREMHYDFKQKLNKIDSLKYRNLLVPEIDWKLNEAQEVFVKMYAEPRVAQLIGFETSQRTIQDVQSIVIDQKLNDGSCIKPTAYDEGKYLVALPADYWFHIKSTVYATKGPCSLKPLSVIKRQHDDMHELSPFDRSSFLWRECNVEFNKDGIILYTNGDFIPDWFCLSYIKVPRPMWNAQDFQGGQYRNFAGQILTGSQDCELPSTVHREIVDIAVLIATGDLQIPDYAVKAAKVKLTN